MAAPRKKAPKQVTRYTHDAHDPVTPETGHADRLIDEQVVTVEMDDGWTAGLDVVRLETDETVVVDMDPAIDPVMLWSGKRNRREVPVLPLQRNEIVSESRIARIIDRARDRAGVDGSHQGTLFADLEREIRESTKEKRIEFYTHEEEWRNKLICGDSLEVMESLIKYEGLSGSVQMIFMDPPYGVSYNSNFQQRVDRAANSKPDGTDDVLTVKAFQDSWANGIHSYLTYLRDRLYLCRELLGESGSLFLQISDDHVHEVRVVLDEVFGPENFCSQISFTKTTGQSTSLLATVNDYLLWYAKDRSRVKYRQVLEKKSLGGAGAKEYTNVELADGSIRKISDAEMADPTLLPAGARVFATGDITSDGGSEKGSQDIELPDGIKLSCGPNLHWKVGVEGVLRLYEKGRLMPRAGKRIYKRYWDDFPYIPLNNLWSDVRGEPGKVYVVQTSRTVVNRCVLMTTDPGDVVFDPTCGSGTTALSAEDYGRRWITCDTSPVSINVARQRLLSAVFAHYVVDGESPSSGFKYEMASRLTMGAVANDLEGEQIPLVDRPEVDGSALRVVGPFEVMTLGRYSIESWRGGLSGAGGGAISENYVSAMCRLYRSDADLLESGGLIHAVIEDGGKTVAVSIGPLTGRVSASQLEEVARDAASAGMDAVHILGWAFEANVGEVMDRLVASQGVGIELIMIRPDALAEGLKVTQPSMLFSPLALPEVDVESLGSGKEGQWVANLRGVTVFDRETRKSAYHLAESSYVVAWYLDEDYDGDCFVDCQMFFNFKKAPNLRTAAAAEVDADEFEIRFRSDPFSPGKYNRIAVKVVDVYGNESTVIKELKP